MDLYWLAECQESVPASDRWLSERELVVLGRLRIPKRRADWRLGRWTAKRAIAGRLGLGPHNLAGIELLAAPSGAPEPFLAGFPAPLSISLSHSHGIAFCTIAAAGTQLGCDVERVEPRSAAFVRDYFTPEEVLQGNPTLLWSAKESALKALQLGLRADPRSVIVFPADGEGPWRPLLTKSAGRILHGWWRDEAGFAWTVVSEPAAVRLTRLSVAEALSVS